MTDNFEPIVPVLQQLFYDKTLRRDKEAKRLEKVVDISDQPISLVKRQAGESRASI